MPDSPGGEPQVAGPAGETRVSGVPPACTAAFFDVDGTLVHATVVHYYAYFATKHCSGLYRAAWTAAFLPKIAYYFALDRISRSAFNRVFYENYAGMDAARLRLWSRDHFRDVIAPRLYPDGVDRVAQHRNRGDRVVLVTGSLDFIMQPLAAFLHADDLIAVTMTEQNGRFTGRLNSPPIGDAEKARVIRSYAGIHGVDLTRSAAYADSRSDLPMLRSVGHPVVVNPAAKLRRIAERNGWNVERWARKKRNDER